MVSSDMTSWRVREALAEDVPYILQMIKVWHQMLKDPDYQSIPPKKSQLHVSDY